MKIQEKLLPLWSPYIRVYTYNCCVVHPRTADTRATPAPASRVPPNTADTQATPCRAPRVPPHTKGRVFGV